jgi:succinate dehydrogenase/fumarate reductase flavoprotein subunit
VLLASPGHERLKPQTPEGRIARMAHDADVLVVGSGLAGLVATAELAGAGRRVILLDQEPEAALGGQAW